MKISHSFFNRQELLQKAKGRYHTFGTQEKFAKYYVANKEVLKENGKNKYTNLSKEEKEGKKEYERNRYRNMTEDKKN